MHNNFVCHTRRTRRIEAFREEGELTESDLHRLSVRGGWTLDRACLANVELISLTARVKHLLPEKRAQFAFGIKDLVAQYVEESRLRYDVWIAIRRQPVRALGSEEKRPDRPQKLTTMVRQELRRIADAIWKAKVAIEGLSPSARRAIEGYFERMGCAAPPRTTISRSFRQEWRRANEEFLQLQVACERAHERTNLFDGEIQAELAKVPPPLDRLAELLEAVSTPTMGVLKLTHCRLSRSGSWPLPANAKSPGSIEGALWWLSLLHSVATIPEVESKPGPDEAPRRRLVCGLAEICRNATGKEPGRVFRADRVRDGESGEFLELARAVVREANELLPNTVVLGTLSLSKIVREVLDARKAAADF